MFKYKCDSPKNTYKSESHRENYKGNSWLERRLEVLSMIPYITWIFVWPAIVVVFLIILLFALLWLKYTKVFHVPCIISLACYLVWIFKWDWKTSDRGSRPSAFVKNLRMWRWMNDYFPIKIVKTPECDLDPSKNYLFCCHPHGMICSGILGAFVTNGNLDKQQFFEKFQFFLFTQKSSFLFPVSREIALRLGICSASRESLNFILGKKSGGNVGLLVVGGAPEILDFCPNKYIIQLKNRKGFVKVALQNGSSIVPVFTFGENVIFSQKRFEKGTFIRSLQDILVEKLHIAAVLFYGRGFFSEIFGIIPYRKPLTVVVGAPLPVERNDNPSTADIDKLHEQYIKALTQLFNDYKEQYSESPNDTLVIT